MGRTTRTHLGHASVGEFELQLEMSEEIRVSSLADAVSPSSGSN